LRFSAPRLSDVRRRGARESRNDLGWEAVKLQHMYYLRSQQDAPPGTGVDRLRDH